MSKISSSIIRYRHNLYILSIGSPSVRTKGQDFIFLSERGREREGERQRPLYYQTIYDDRRTRARHITNAPHLNSTPRTGILLLFCKREYYYVIIYYYIVNTRIERTVIFAKFSHKLFSGNHEIRVAKNLLDIKTQAQHDREPLF